MGTSGFSYAEWKGDFYPAGTKNADMLREYAARLPTVEINNTFYRLPRRSVLEGWAEKTPEHFRFAVKASRRVTHFSKLSDCESLVNYLFQGLEVLGPRLGTVLFQLPPTFRADLPRLASFLASLPAAARGVPLTFEFRHDSWFRDTTYELLREHRAALCGGEGDDEGRAPAPLVETADFVYLRLRKDAYSEAELDAWATRILGLEAKRALVYFKHETSGPHLARSLLERLRQG